MKASRIALAALVCAAAGFGFATADEGKKKSEPKKEAEVKFKKIVKTDGASAENMEVMNGK